MRKRKKNISRIKNELKYENVYTNPEKGGLNIGKLVPFKQRKRFD